MTDTTQRAGNDDPRAHMTWQEAIDAYHPRNPRTGWASPLTRPIAPSVCRQAWRDIAKARAKNGDKEGAARARRNASAILGDKEYRP